MSKVERAGKAEDASTQAIDPLTLAVVRHKLLAVAEEVVETMVRTCFSPLLNQSLDFSAVILDTAGRVLAQAERVPIHMGAMPFAVRALSEAFSGDVAEDDVLMMNDPYWGGSHLPDVTLAKPVFRDGRLRFWVANRTHQADIGGLSAGGYAPKAREIWQEGLRIPPVKIVERGAVREDLLRLFCENTRKPDEARGDMMAELTSVAVGAERLVALFERYGTDHVLGSAEAILDAGEAAMQDEIGRWRTGTFEGVSHIDDDGCGNGPTPIRVRVTLAGGRAVVDFSDSPDQVFSYFNSPIANTVAGVHAAFMYLSESKQAQNEGSARAIEVITRKGSLVDPNPPAAIGASTTFTSSVIIESVLRAVEQAAPAQAIAGFCRRFRFVISGYDRSGRSYIWHHSANRGGAGANRRTDGWSNLGVILNPGGAPSPAIERIESGFPLVVEQYALRIDSAGAGRMRGGLGGTYVLRYEGDAPAVLNAAGDGVAVAPYGIDGGAPGEPNDFRIVRDGAALPLGITDTEVRLDPGDRIVCRSGGGGGYGRAAERDPALIGRDLEYGYITEQAAREAFGLACPP